MEGRIEGCVADESVVVKGCAADVHDADMIEGCTADVCDADVVADEVESCVDNEHAEMATEGITLKDFGNKTMPE